MKAGEKFIIEREVGGFLWEHEIFYTGNKKMKNKVLYGQFARTDDASKTMTLSKNQLNALIAVDWEEGEL
jgi:hypothetical protein